MALRSRVHADYAAIKRSRSGYQGNITKIAEKLSELAELDLSQVSIRTVEGLVKSCTTSESRYLNTLDEAHTFLSREEEAETLLQEECGEKPPQSGGRKSEGSRLGMCSAGSAGTSTHNSETL